MSEPTLLAPLDIAHATAQFFGEPVLQITAPGGAHRTSFRVFLASRSLIVTQRHDTRITDLECDVLQRLDGHCDAVPRYLGRSGGLMFQSDAGSERLNRQINSVSADMRPALARQAVQAIFDLHRAARRINLAARLPAAGILSYPDDDLMAMVQDMSRDLGILVADFDPVRLDPGFRAEPAQFAKWDCRSGNAALDSTGTLRWFDFEEARRAQGPEDFGWLVADESWPLQIQDTLAIVQNLLTPDDSSDPAAYMAYLEQFSALHALRRLRLIVREVRRSGRWRDRVTILKYDNVGVNPVMGERLARSGANLCDRHAALKPLKPLFAHMITLFATARHTPA